MSWQSEIYSKMCIVKPDIRDILWAYERDRDLGKAVNNMGEILDHVWNYAIEQAIQIVQPVPHIDEERRCEDIAYDIRGLKLK